MRSPFPGMDPYIEASGRWPDFHNRLINRISEVLADAVGKQYEVSIDERIRLVKLPDAEVKSIRPDVAVLDRGRDRSHPQASGAVATIEPVAIAHPVYEEVRETRVTIIWRPDWKLITVIEALSPANKSGREDNDYLPKRWDLVQARVNLVELDLLIAGCRLPMRRPLPPGDYYALLTRADRLPVADVYAWPIEHPLPTIPIPLRPSEPDLMLDLSAVFQDVYQRGHYARSIDYHASLNLPLPEHKRKWAMELAGV